MSDDPNKKQNEGSGWSQQSGQRPGQQSEQQRDDPSQSQKRPSEKGNDGSQDREHNEHGGQRRAS
jgi:hypothetical protein